ncbi:ribosomal protein S6 (macronuclear) [Tetrahymena thermophila SB210]|uniref:Ribosomal protein S6 n=1 Tax=Tetrahymena thermophila (strain SB210) TaxID=312017 RepID=I7MHS2_TETTS|nr:ribosomal protein S6 [Tetrahymena thermophila SB210]EAS03219.1 ribosomal protein S6 [Tetrahymena thermophila SB210]6Z1P_Bg Chain Bg, Ribosomal protein S6 [Tetrahymena thermophila SB210]|eukprot:XP_001023464.1 ribosomal protein S6 [Tetrahymena thermophila SB210]
MPLYELIVLARANTAKATTSLVSSVAQSILEKGGNVRNTTILGDRILNRTVKGNDDKKHLVGRYVQILYDGNPQMMGQIEKAARESNEGIRAKTFKIKDFYSDAQLFRRALKQTSPVYPSYLNDKSYLHQLKQIAKKTNKQ